MFRRDRHKPWILEPYPTPRRRSAPYRLLLNGLLLFVTFVTGFGFALQLRADETAQAETARGIAHAGQLLLTSVDSSATTSPMLREPSLHLHSHARVHIAGMVASVQLSQSFKNDRDSWAEGVYVFPLPENAAVSYMEIRVGDRRIIGQIAEKQEAQKRYQAARDAGQKTALVEQQRDNLFTQSIANIAPDETVTVILHYQHTVQFDHDEFTLRLPMTLTPRFFPGVSPATPTGESAGPAIPMSNETRIDTATNPRGWALPTDQVPDADRISPFMMTQNDGRTRNPMTLEVTLDSGLPLAHIDSPYHAITIEKHGDVHRITTRSPSVPMDRDFALTWRAASGQTPSAALFSERIANTDYAMLMLLPPQWQQDNRQPLPRQVLFIIDTSGSMQGTSIVQAKASLQLALAQLQPQDHFEVIEFNDRARRLFGDSVVANTQNTLRARHFVASLRADGGTNMAPALEAAMTTADREGLIKQIVFITDGSVGNESELLEQIHQQLGNARLFTVGIGSAPNSFFMRKAAEFGRGTMTQIGASSEVSDKMDRLFEKLSSPVLTNLQVNWPAGLAADVWPKALPDLYQGEPLLLHARFDHRLPPGRHELTVSGDMAGQSWQHTVAFTVADTEPKSATENQQPTHHGAIGKLWARQKIAALLDEKIRGRDAQAVRSDVLALALQHDLLSPYTSFVAVEDSISRPAESSLEQAPVPNLIAAGQTMLQAQTVAYPRTATAMSLHMLLGALTLLLWFAWQWSGRHRAAIHAHRFHAHQ